MLALIAIIVPAFLLYSPKVEHNRIVTISRLLVITQERKTPAYFLYQKVKAVEKTSQIQPQVTTYLSSESYVPPQTALAMKEMQVNRREIASDVDAGFSTEAFRFHNEKPADQISPAPDMTVSGGVTAPILETVANPPTESPRQSLNGKWATIRGKFESRGIGFINQIIELKRVEEGQVREVGRVDLNAGLYSIDIENPKGTLVAVIRDRNGIVIGQDDQPLEKLVSRGNYFEGPFIQIRSPNGLASNLDIPAARATGRSAVSAVSERGSQKVMVQKSSGFATTLFSNQNLLENPNDEFTNVSRYASTISYVSDQMSVYRKLLTIRQSEDKSQTPVFSEKWIAGLLEYISDQQKIEFKSNQISILIGRAMIDGKPAAGVQMQVENHPGIYPIYLDQFMIPNTRQTETSENGYFLFIGLEDATYMVSAFRQNQIIGHQMFIAQQGVISYQNVLSQTVARSVVVRSFDAFTSEPIEVDVTTPDLEEIIETTNGVTHYRTHSALSVTQFYVRAKTEDYSPIRYFQDARKNYVHLPQIRESWLKQIQSQRLINDMNNASTFVGFVPEMDYQVYLVYEGYNRDQIVYFDSHGRISPVPVKGGGFILYNVPTDAHEIVVQQEGSDRIYSQVFESQNAQVGVSHFAD